MSLTLLSLITPSTFKLDNLKEVIYDNYWQNVAPNAIIYKVHF